MEKFAALSRVILPTLFMWKFYTDAWARRDFVPPKCLPPVAHRPTGSFYFLLANQWRDPRHWKGAPSSTVLLVSKSHPRPTRDRQDCTINSSVKSYSVEATLISNQEKERILSSASRPHPLASDDCMGVFVIRTTERKPEASIKRQSCSLLPAAAPSANGIRR